ncbi:MAG: hypothetical protein QM343_01105 [Bacillota bacterium]|nr:hypothetical protein [Bacillota bacterium]
MRTISKKSWIALTIIVLLAIGVALAYQPAKDYYTKSKLDPQAELLASIQKMAQLKSYRYALKSGFTVDGREEVISEVEGEKEQANTHLKGEMVNTPVDIYYIDRTIYNYDSFSDKWLVIDSGTVNSEELLISELNPLSNFRFKNISGITKVGFEAVDGTECLVVSCQPSVESQLLESLWEKFNYQLWIDYKQQVIRKAALRAVNKQNPSTHLSIEVEFYDINQPIKIKPPDTAKPKS